MLLSNFMIFPKLLYLKCYENKIKAKRKFISKGNKGKRTEAREFRNFTNIPTQKGRQLLFSSSCIVLISKGKAFSSSPSNLTMVWGPRPQVKSHNDHAIQNLGNIFIYPLPSLCHSFTPSAF